MEKRQLQGYHHPIRERGLCRMGVHLRLRIRLSIGNNNDIQVLVIVMEVYLRSYRLLSCRVVPVVVMGVVREVFYLTYNINLVAVAVAVAH